MRVAWVGYCSSVVIVVTGGIVGARLYPGGFDWVYEVMSALASQKHNPEGSMWFAGGLALGLASLGPVVYQLSSDAKLGAKSERVAARVLGFGVFCGVMVGLERLFFYHFSDVFDKGHELLAVFSFLSLFAGVLGLSVTRSRRAGATPWGIALVLAPLLAIGLGQLALYFDQRDLGWVDTEWREMGIPFWYSFAFWQWLAAGSLWVSLAVLLSQRPKLIHAAVDDDK